MNKSRPQSHRLRSLCTLLALAFNTPAMAHDFWLQPAHFRMAPGVPTALTMQVGHGAQRQRSPMPARRVLRFAAVGSAGVADVRSALHPGQAADDGTLTFAQAGTYVLLFETDNRAQSHLPAPRFNDYLRAEGLSAVLAERERSNSGKLEGSESYSRCAKVIVQVGAGQPDGERFATTALGLPLEIVPEVLPYALPNRGMPPPRLPISVLYMGQPLAGATVRLTNLEQDAEPFETRISDRHGRADFSLPKSGRWMLNVVWSVARPRGSETDFATIFSSLSFGYD